MLNSPWHESIIFVTSGSPAHWLLEAGIEPSRILLASSYASWLFRNERTFCNWIYMLFVNMERQINIYSNICTYLQIFVPRYKSFIPIFKSFVPSFNSFTPRYKWVEDRCKWFIPIFKYDYLHLGTNDLYLGTNHLYLSSNTVGMATFTISLWTEAELYLGTNDLNLSSNQLWIFSTCT